MITKKVSTTIVLEKLKIIIITMEYTRVQHIQYANLNTQHKEIHVVIHNGSNYDFHLRIKELAAESKEEIHCIPEDKQKYKSFSIPIMYKSAEKYEYPCNLRFIDSKKFMLGSLVSHVNNLYEMYSCNCSNESNQQN